MTYGKIIDTRTTISEPNLIKIDNYGAFIDVFVEMFHDYAQYLSFLEEDTVFNKSLFMEKRKGDKKFLYALSI